MKSVRTRKATLVLALIVTVAAFAPSATSGKPIREPAPVPESFVDPTCGFPILIEVLDQNEFIKIFDSGRAIVTGTLKVRLSAGENWIELNISGPLHISEDGTLVLGGRSVNPFPAGALGPGSDPVILLNSGRMVVTFDEEGNPTLIDIVGRSTDLCAVLAP
jgi:hypothetical protein